MGPSRQPGLRSPIGIVALHRQPCQQSVRNPVSNPFKARIRWLDGDRSLGAAGCVDAIDPRYRALVLVGAFGGLRIGELAALQLGDFDPLRSLIRVRRTASDVRGEIIVGPPKTAKSIRPVALPRSITEQLVEHIAQLDIAGPETWIFPAPEGGPIRRTAWIRRVWKPALAAADLDHDLGTHTLRRSQVALLIAQGEHPKVIADRLGHTSVRTVLDVYGHLYEGADEAAAERLETQIGAVSRPLGSTDIVHPLGR